MPLSGKTSRLALRHQVLLLASTSSASLKSASAPSVLPGNRQEMLLQCT